MKKILLFLITICVFQNCLVKNDKDNQLIIDKDIQKKVEREIIDTIQKNKSELHYDTPFNFDFYQNDTLQTLNMPKYKQFRSSWKKRNDTVDICGFLDLGGSIGFGMTIVDRIPKIYLLVAGVGRQVAHNKEDKLERAMSVQTKLAKVTLSKIPDNLPPETIYGFVEFESKTFYQANHFENGQEVPNQRDAVRINMKIYFKANRDDSLADFQTIFIRNHLNDN